MFRKIYSIGSLVLFLIIPCLGMDLNEGLVGYWSFDKGTATDISGNNNNGSIHGAVPVDGVSGQALSYDGIDDFVSVPDSSTLHSDRAVSVSAWVRPGSIDKKWQSVYWKGNVPDCISTGNCGNRENALWIHETGFLHLTSTPINKLDISQSWLSAGHISNGNWTHICSVVNASDGRMKLFMNGSEIGMTDYGNNGSSIRDTYGPLVFGSNPSWDSAFKGEIDEIRIYNRVLSNSEIQFLYEHPGGNVLVVDQPDYHLWGNHRYDAVIVKNCGSIVVDPPAQWVDGQLHGAWLRLVINGPLVVEPCSSILADGAGYNVAPDDIMVGYGGPGVGVDSVNFISLPGGGSYAGRGGEFTNGTSAGSVYAKCNEIDYIEGGVAQMGSRGGGYYLPIPIPKPPAFVTKINCHGGAGGGAIEITAQSMEIGGTISANGGAGKTAIEMFSDWVDIYHDMVTSVFLSPVLKALGIQYHSGFGSGGGSGGQIILEAREVKIESTGIIKAAGGETKVAGAGGGGKILIATPIFSNQGSITAPGGIAFDSKANGQPGIVCTPETNCTPGGTESIPPTDINLVSEDDSGKSSTDRLTNVVFPRISGGAEPFSDIVLYEGSTRIGGGFADKDGLFVAQVTTLLSDGSHILSATARQTCRNESLLSSPITIIINTQKPAAPTSIDLIEEPGSAGLYSDDNIISDPTPSFTGTVEPDQAVVLYADGKEVSNGYPQNGQWNLTSSSLAEGQHQMAISVKDAAGNESDIGPALQILVDLTLPQISNIQITPSGCQAIGKEFTFSATVSDALSGINTVWGIHSNILYAGEDFIDQVILKHIGNGIFSGTWDSTGFDEGTYTVELNAWDIADNQQRIPNAGLICLNTPTPYCGDDNHPYPTADVNQDCSVDMMDYSIFARQWQKHNCSQDNNWCSYCDLNKDQNVGLEDLALLTESWLDCTSPNPPCNHGK